MALPVIMPRQGQSVESCIIAKWHKQKGDNVSEGDILFTYETDKATFDEEAQESGVLLEVFFEEGEDVPVLTNVCVIGKEGEDASGFEPGGSAGKPKKEIEAKPSGIQVQSDGGSLSEAVEIINADNGGKAKISPRARNFAHKKGVDYSKANGSGPGGRIIEKDIVTLAKNGYTVTSSAMDEYKASGLSGIEGTGIGGRIRIEDLENREPAGKVYRGEQPGYEDIKLTNIRKVIANAMHHSLSSTAQLTLNSSFDASDIMAYRKKIKASMEKLGLSNITLNDLVLYAVSRTLKAHRNLNAHFLDDTMRVFDRVHLGVAIDTERGLMVPTVFDSDLKSLNGISKEVKLLADQCQKGTINPDALKGGTFTVTNLGALGIESFTPVLNPPQTGILGVNTIVQRVKAVNGDYKYYPAMGLSLTFDHRAVDGAPAARFLKELSFNLENFSVLLAK